MQPVFFDVVFPVVGGILPIDHSYHLFCGLGRHLPPEFHTATGPWSGLGVHPINGRYEKGSTQLQITDKSQLSIRANADVVNVLMQLLSCKAVQLDNNGIILGWPNLYPLAPCHTLYSRIVTIAKYTDPVEFKKSAEKMLALNDIAGELKLTERDGQVISRTRQIKDSMVRGFPVAISKLSPLDSFKLQVIGLGGRRHFGCGLFLPAK